MQALRSPVLLLLAGCVICKADHASAANSMSPVSRVVELLQGLSKEAEADGKKEEDLYEKFVCWGKTIIDAKTASNAAANARIQELTTYIADLDAGRIELTSERQDLEKQMADILGAIETATEIRENEHKDFESAKQEMNQAISALEDAIKVLKEATTEHGEPSFLQAQGALSVQSGTSTAEAAILNQAAELGARFLSKGDALFLRRILVGDFPQRASWKNLNRKATFKMSYKARSGKIQALLAKLLETFQTNLKSATEKEAEAQKSFDELMKAKNEEKKATEDAMIKMEKENGARGMSRQESMQELEALQDQIKNDETFIKQVTDSVEEKKIEWKDRMALRTAELGAISKAIEILHNDDSRDLFKKSFTSQGYSFVQMKMDSKQTAYTTLRHAARAGKDERLSKIAATVAAGSHFKEVVIVIDKMVATLKAEEAADLKKKEDCETTRAEDTRAASLASRDIDDSTDAITKLEKEIKELKDKIKEAQLSVEAIDKDLADAKKVREEGAAEFAANKKDDEDAGVLVVQAKDVLHNFYKDNNLMLVQQPAVEAGKAPPPPPTTWEAPYGGKTEQSTNIVAILEMIKEDIDKDIADAVNEENEAIALYQKTVKSLTKDKEVLLKEISKMQGTQSKKEEEALSEKKIRATRKKELGAVMSKIADAEPGCDFFTINYPVRVQNRQVEIDGLLKAKAILLGATFDELPDEGREIKPGDAFFQQQMSRRLRGA